MIKTTQLKVTLPSELQGFLKVKASRLGLNMSAYVKNLIINDVKAEEYPVMQASKSTEEAYRNAIKEQKHAIQVDNLDDFFKDL